MTHTRLGCDDAQGLRARVYDAGQTYEIGATLARQFLESDVADPAPANAAISRPRRIEPADERRNVGASMLTVPVDPMRRALADRLLGASSERGIGQGSNSPGLTGIDQGSGSSGRGHRRAETTPPSAPPPINTSR